MVDINIKLVSGVVATALIMPAAFAEDRSEPRPAALVKLVDCRSIADDARRLACYDLAVNAIDKAEREKELVVVDRGQIRKARRSLFGLTLPNLGIFGSRDDAGAPDEEGVTRIETTIARAMQDPMGKWIMILPDGARWLQIDSRDVPRSPRAGMPIVIRRAAMGSFLAKVDGQIAIRVRRIN